MGTGRNGVVPTNGLDTTQLMEDRMLVGVLEMRRHRRFVRRMGIGMVPVSTGRLVSVG